MDRDPSRARRRDGSLTARVARVMEYSRAYDLYRDDLEQRSRSEVQRLAQMMPTTDGARRQAPGGRLSI